MRSWQDANRPGQVVVYSGDEQNCTKVMKLMRARSINAYITWETRQGHKMPYTHHLVVIPQEQKADAEKFLKDMELTESENVRKYEALFLAGVIKFAVIMAVVFLVALVVTHSSSAAFGYVLIAVIALLMIYLVRALFQPENKDSDRETE